MPEHHQIQQSKKPDTIFQKQATPVVQTPNLYSIIQCAKINPKSLTHADIMQLQHTIGNRAVGRLLSGIGNTSTSQQATVQRQEIPEEEELLQGKMIETIHRQETPEEEEPLQRKMIGTIQRQEIPEEEEPLQTKRENNTGMPDNLKAGVESLSGIDMSNVRVNYNSSKPADVGALAYTQGTNTHVAPGQERHLPHETWHVVQQAQGRVMPTMQLKVGISVNDDEGLEHEADAMGAKALVNTAKLKGEPKKELLQNHSVPSITPVQAIFLEPIKSMTYADIKKQLEQTYTNVPAMWRIQQLASVSDKTKYGTLEEVALALGLVPLDKNVGVQPQSVKVQTPIDPVPASKEQPVSPDDEHRDGDPSPSVDYLNMAKGLTMARMEYPKWEQIEPLLGGYLTPELLTEKNRQAIKKVIETSAKNPEVKIRGIPDLIERAGIQKVDKIANHVREENTLAAPDIVNQKTVKVARGDSRRPKEIFSAGGLFGWDAGIVTVEHARSLVQKVLKMRPQAQKNWVDNWKRPTPSRDERNPWVATGIISEQGAKGAQKNADSEYICELPLQFIVKSGDSMHVGTDTGDIDSANVIGVQLDPNGNGNGDEVIVLTGIPWKYITKWNDIEKQRLVVV